MIYSDLFGHPVNFSDTAFVGREYTKESFAKENEAALRIQRAVLKRMAKRSGVPPLESPFFSTTLKFRAKIVSVEEPNGGSSRIYYDSTDLNFEALKSGVYDDEIRKCFDHCYYRRDRLGLHLLCYALFSAGRLTNSHFMNRLKYFPLIILLYDRFSSWDALRVSFFKTLDVLKTSNCIMADALDRPRKDDHWGQKREIPPEEMIDISHSGGFFHMIDYFAGRSPGYPLEDNRGLGIQVHPYQKTDSNAREYAESKVKFYARRNTFNFFDIPAHLTGEVQAKYLENAPNGYESAIHAHEKHHLKEREIKLVPIGHMDEYFPTDLDSLFGEDKKTIAAIIDSTSRMSPKPIGKN